MTLAGLLTPILVPPANLAVLALLFLLLRWRRLAAACLVLLLLLAMPVVADSLLGALENSSGEVADQAAQAIVVLGAEVERVQSQGDPPVVDPGLLTLERLRGAASLARRTGLPVLVSGGATAPDEASVASAMARSLAEDFAIQPRWVEGRSATTWENARDSAAILLPAGIRRVWVVTHGWHMPRALLAFRDCGLVALPAPVAAGPRRPPGFDDLMPRASAWMRSYYALHEWIGLAWYGWLARHGTAAPP